jgi:hypothetical protein
MVFLNDGTTIIDKYPVRDIEEVYLLQKNSRVNENPGPNAEASSGIYKPGRDHTHTIFLISHLDSMPRVGTDPAAGDHGRLIVKCNVSNNLSLPLVTEKSADDYGTAHCPTI